VTLHRAFRANASLAYMLLCSSACHASGVLDRVVGEQLARTYSWRLSSRERSVGIVDPATSRVHRSRV